MSDTPVVLVVEDELSIRKFIVINLKHSSFAVVEAGSGEEAFSHLASTPIDFVILDLMLPDMDGLVICEKIRNEYPNLPIIILSARGQDMDKIMGLELGADDYLVKPFNPLELVARVRSVLRRTKNSAPTATNDHVTVSGPFTLNRQAKQLSKGGIPLKLTQREYLLMEFFIEQKNISLSRDEILNHIWGENYFGDVKTVDVHIRRLREKVEHDPSSPRFIETVWGFGYRYCEETP